MTDPVASTTGIEFTNQGDLPMWKKTHVFMAEETGGDIGGAGAGSFDFSSGVSYPETQGGQSQAVAIPEKYQVKKEDGSLDIEASSLKLAEAYGHLEKRMGSGDLPPKTADEYQLTVPDTFKDLGFSEDPALLQFKQDAFAKGLTQDQFDFFLGKYFEIAPGLAAGVRQLSMDECVADLRTEWKGDDRYGAEMQKSYRAAVGFGGGDAEGLMRDYGNDPRFIRMLNRIGAEMEEDRSVNPGGSHQGGHDVGALMSSDAYNDPKHPDHAKVSAQVRAHFERLTDSDSRYGRGAVL